MAELRDVDRYVDEWTRTQLLIWKEKIERLKVVRSGRLHQSFSDSISDSAAGKTITMKFARYGIYQALGVGRGYSHDNGGDLRILDKSYREAHGLDKPRWAGPIPPLYDSYMTSGKPRKKRDWYSRKLYMSTMAMVEDLARITGDEGVRIICEALSDTRNALR